MYKLRKFVRIGLCPTFCVSLHWKLYERILTNHPQGGIISNLHGPSGNVIRDFSCSVTGQSPYLTTLYILRIYVVISENLFIDANGCPCCFTDWLCSELPCIDF